MFAMKLRSGTLEVFTLRSMLALGGAFLIHGSASAIQDAPAAEVERELEGGALEVVKVPLPCLLTVQTGIRKNSEPKISTMARPRSDIFR